PSPHPSLPLFPYTTLFRSRALLSAGIFLLSSCSFIKHEIIGIDETPPGVGAILEETQPAEKVLKPHHFGQDFLGGAKYRSVIQRSEEHTSELQSQSNLVCR